MCMFVVELSGGLYKAAVSLGEASSALVGRKWIHLQFEAAPKQVPGGWRCVDKGLMFGFGEGD